MVTLIILLIFASWHDIRQRRIPNYVTYSGLVIVFACAIHTDYLAFPGGIAESTRKNSLIVDQANAADGFVSVKSNEILNHKASSVSDWAISQTAVGCLGLTIPLLLLYCCGGIGGGDVKLGACIGAFVGLESGFSILFLGHVFAGTIAFLFLAFGFLTNRFVDSRRHSSFESQDRSLNSRGVPMACFYLVGALCSVWSF